LRSSAQNIVAGSLVILFGLISASASAASLSVTIVDQDGEPVDDAVIYIESINGTAPTYTAGSTDVDQVDKTYVPHVRVITRGTTLSFPNFDNIRHHVYSFSDAKTFELPLYMGTSANPVLFDKAGLVDLGCNIHDFMRAYVLVLKTPYYAKSVGGELQLDGFEDGSIEMAVWHPRLVGDEVIRQQIEIVGTHRLELNVELRGEKNTGRAPKRRRKRY
jgi:plastocyanin